MNTQPDSVTRFDNRVASYALHRPRYPQAVLTQLQTGFGLTPEMAVADIGAGTGLLSELFLRNGNFVYVVEPNATMLAKAEQLLGDLPGFQSVDGRSEATGLPLASVDWVVAGQAFHWFEPTATRAEFQRILKPGGHVALVWNSRREEGTSFLRGYQSLLEEFGTDYRQVDHKFVVDGAGLTRFFAPGAWVEASFVNEQVLDWAALVGRLTSTSYVPAPGDERYEVMLARLAALFAANQQAGIVTMVYDTKLCVGSFG